MREAHTDVEPRLDQPHTFELFLLRYCAKSLTAWRACGEDASTSLITSCTQQLLATIRSTDASLCRLVVGLSSHLIAAQLYV